MVALDKVLDDTPTSRDIARLAELRIRNLQAFSELQAYNDSGKWRYKHPLIIHMSERFQLEELRRRNPEAFLKEYANCSLNVRRYSSYTKSEKRKNKREQDRENLQKHIERKTIFENILSDDAK